MNRVKLVGVALAVTMLAAGAALLTHRPGPDGIVMVPSVGHSNIHPKLPNISYGSTSSSQKLDLYKPDGHGPFPVVIYVHGGGFRFGDRTMASSALIGGMIKAGYAVASVDYRLSGEAQFPAAVQDIFSAVAYLKDHSATLDLDTMNVAIFGESAGANLASLVGVAFNDPTFRQDVKTDDIDLKPIAVVAHFPPVDFLQIDTMLETQGCKTRERHNASDSFESVYLGKPLEEARAKVAQTNPVTYVTAQSAPFLIQNGDNDCMVGSGQSGLLVAALKQSGVPVQYDQFPGASHGGSQFETPENIRKIISFIHSHQISPETP